MDDGRWIDWLCERLKPGMTVIDVGAGHGTWTWRLADAVSPGGHVYACEPVTDQVRALLVGATDRPITTMQVAVGARSGRVSLYVDLEDARQSSLWRAAVQRPVVEVDRVQVLPLDDLCDFWDVTQVALIKVDTQGAEAAVLAGAPVLLASPGTVWLMELWPYGLSAADSSVEAVCAQFADSGYHAAVMDPSVPALVSWPDIVHRATAQSQWAGINVLALRPTATWLYDHLIPSEATAHA